jgi:hypothetical protein
MSDLTHISPSYTAGAVDLTKLDDRIKVYEDQIKGWFFGPVKALLSVPHSAFAVLHILMGYFENHAIYRRGQSSDRKSREFFCEGFTAVFPKAAEADLPESTSKKSPGGSLTPCTMTPAADCFMSGSRDAGSL